MRVVVDTNVFVSSFFGGVPKKVIELWRDGRITICLSAPIVDEYIEVLGRMGLAGTNELAELLQLFRTGHHAVFTTKTPALQVSADPDNDKFIEAAVALRADCVVSGDKHLLDVGEYIRIPILKPRAFLERFAAGE